MSEAKELARKSLRIEEGLRFKAYKCSEGHWTLGYGRNLEALGFPDEVASVMQCTKEEAEQWLEIDLSKAERDAEKLPGYFRLNDVRKAVLIDMVYNMGLRKLWQFKDMLAALAAGNIEQVCIEMMDSKWARQLGDGIGGRMDRPEHLYLEMKHGKRNE